MIMDNEAGHIFHDATLDNLGQIRQYVRETAVSGGCIPVMIDEFIVAVNEAVSNIIRHGFKHKPGDIKVIVVCSVDTIKVTLLDKCLGFNPTTVATPNTTLPLAERPFGGMGVHMMREFCDELSYRRTENDENELTLLKRVDSGVEG